MYVQGRSVDEAVTVYSLCYLYFNDIFIVMLVCGCVCCVYVCECACRVCVCVSYFQLHILSKMPFFHGCFLVSNDHSTCGL